MGANPQISEDLQAVWQHTVTATAVFAERAHKPTVLPHSWKDILRAIPGCKLEIQ